MQMSNVYLPYMLPAPTLGGGILPWMTRHAVLPQRRHVTGVGVSVCTCLCAELRPGDAESIGKHCRSCSHYIPHADRAG